MRIFQQIVRVHFYKYVIRNFVFTVLISSFCCKQPFAQHFSIYQSITTSNGLPSNYVFAVCEDENGFLWAGTDKGLCRYDAFSWQVYDKDNGLPGNYINKLYANKRGGLWMDIGGKGFFNFNIATGQTQKDSLPSSTDKNGNLYYEIHLQIEGINRAYLIAPDKLSPPHKVYEYKPDYNLIMSADAN